MGRAERIRSTVFPRTYRLFLHALIYLFVRFLPIISIFEVRTLLPEAHVHGHQQDFDESVLEVEYTYERTDPPNK